MRLVRRAWVAVATLTFVGCAGQPFPAPIQDEPVCTDFELGPGRDKMEGALQHPVQIRFLEGKAQLQKVVLHGRRSEDIKPPRSFLPDDNTEITVEWAQCGNEWAPHLRKEKAGPRGIEPTNAYQCGEAVVYKTETLSIKRHQPDTHVLHFALPPNASCWTSDAAPEAPKPAPVATPSADPATAPSAEPSASASAQVRAPAAPKPTK